MASGFTLVELLVVLGIIGCLIGILLPAAGRTRHLAKRVVCMNNLRALGRGYAAYEAEFRAIPWEGYAEGDRPVRHLGRWDDMSQWFNCGPAYAGDTPYYKLQELDAAGTNSLPLGDGGTGMFVCPESSVAMPGPQDDLVTDGYLMLWGLSSAGSLDRRKTFWCYGYNTQLDAGVEDRHSGGMRITLTRAKIPNPADTVLLSEKLMRPDEINPPFGSGVGQSATSWKEFTTRHDGGGFILYLDNHIGFHTRFDVDDVIDPAADHNQPTRGIIWNPGGAAN